MNYSLKKTAHLAVYALVVTILLFLVYNQVVATLEFKTALLFRFGGSTAFIFALLLYVKNQEQQDKVTKGTRLVTPKTFNRLVRGDGVWIPTKLETHWYHRLIPGTSPTMISLKIRQSDEPVHMLISGDSETGKSALQHTFLLQIAERPGDRAAVYDPSCEFWEQHANLERGDILLHPLEAECPYWDIASEIRNPLDAASLAKSFIPDTVEDKVDFWDFAPRQLLTQLFLELKKQNKGTEMLVKWLADPEPIFDLVAGTEAEVLIDKNAQRSEQGYLLL